MYFLLNSILLPASFLASLPGSVPVHSMPTDPADLLAEPEQQRCHIHRSLQGQSNRQSASAAQWHCPTLCHHSETPWRSKPTQRSPSIVDTLGTWWSVVYQEVSSLPELIYIKKAYFGHSKVSFIQRCPYFRGVLFEGFHCIANGKMVTRRQT